MSSILKVDQIKGSTGSTIEIPAGQTLVNNGSATGFGPLASGIVGVSTFTASGTWTKATREAALGVTIKRVIVEVQGGGGAGGDGSGSPSGAGGGYARKLIDVSSISSSTITVGAGGPYGSTGAGASGGATTWDDGTNTVTGNGGAGGQASLSSYRNGGTASGGDINIQGGSAGAYGGNSVFGFGGNPRSGTSNSNATYNARGYGAGGGGSGGGSQGGGGTGGIVIVWEIAG